MFVSKLSILRSCKIAFDSKLSYIRNSMERKLSINSKHLKTLYFASDTFIIKCILYELFVIAIVSKKLLSNIFLKLLLRMLHNHDKQSIVCCFTCTNFIHGNSRYRFIVIIFKHNCYALYCKTRGFFIFCKSNFLMLL